MTDTLQDTDLKREAVKEPARKWRNLYSCERAINTQLNGYVEPGKFWGAFEYASKREAEISAAEHMAREVFYAIEEGVRYLGAFPVDWSDA